MTCPDIGAHYVIVKWMFDVCQVICIIAVWKILEYLWGLTRPKD